MPKLKLKEPDSLSIPKVAKLIGVSPEALRGWIKDKKIPLPEGRRNKQPRWTRAEAEALKKQVWK